MIERERLCWEEVSPTFFGQTPLASASLASHSTHDFVQMDHALKLDTSQCHGQ
jgi:hypothetical protein